MNGLDVGDFTGAFGGMLSVAFAMGAVGGWGLAMKIMSARIADLRNDMETERKRCDERIAELEEWVRQTVGAHVSGLERQNQQLSKSGIRVMRDKEGFSR